VCRFLPRAAAHRWRFRVPRLPRRCRRAPLPRAAAAPPTTMLYSQSRITGSPGHNS
jgi:hypothetical protein